MSLRRRKFKRDPNYVHQPCTEENKYSVKVIEGTGSRAQFVKISDQIVRGSRIFWHLSEKIHEAKRIAGILRTVAKKWREKYNDLLKAFKQFEKDADRILKLEALKNQKLQKRIEELKDLVRRTDNRRRIQIQKRKVVVANNKKLAKRKTAYEGSENFFSKKFTWYLQHSGEAARIELLLRGVFGFKVFQLTNDITDMELIFLTVGHQLDAFNKSHIEARYGTELTKYFKRDMKRLIDKGYIRRFERKDLYYVTDDGKKLYTEIFKKIYTREYHRYFSQITEKLKD